MSFTAPILAGKSLPEPVVLGHFLPWFTQEDVDSHGLTESESKDLIVPKLEPWRHWRDSRGEYRRSHLFQPLWGQYDSRNREIMRKQIQTALDFGLDGFIINLYGKNSVENVLGLHFLREIRAYNEENPQRPFTHIISFDAQAQWPSEGKTPVTIAEDFAYLKEVWCEEAYLRRDGRFPFLVFAYDRPCSEYREALAKVFGADGFDLLWLNNPGEKAMDAGYPWVRPMQVELDHRWFSPDDSGAEFIRDFYARCNDQAHLKYLCGGVWPGFNDQLVRWAWSGNPNDPKIRPRVICRHTTKGSTLELTWQATVDYIQRHRRGDATAKLPMPLIQIVTWNDWAEATQVEPCADLGCGDLEVCKKYINSIKAIETDRKK
jgi:hypothetical protein